MSELKILEILVSILIVGNAVGFGLAFGKIDTLWWYMNNEEMRRLQDYTSKGEWKNILNFEKWVLEHPFFEGATLDRIDSDKDYEPNNCRWATMFEQDKNRRNSIVIEWNGETHNITEWSKITGINRSTLNNRYYRGDRGERLFEGVRYNKCHA